MKPYEELYSALVQNKKYKTISKGVVQRHIVAYFKKHPAQQHVLQRPSSEKYKKIVQHIRSELHAIHGTFQTTKKSKREEYLALLQRLLRQKNVNQEEYLRLHNKILETNRSTKERLQYYPSLYKQIFRYTGNPQTILDLGCGLNPISYPYMHLQQTTYFAYDIDTADISFLSTYFKILSLRGKAAILDLNKLENIRSLPQADVAFLFNALDPLDQGKGHKLSEMLITVVPARFVVASFSTMTVSGKSMNYPYRGWIERMLERLGFSFTLFQTPNELFYIIEKNKT